jgi:hypothetical protein
VPGFPQPENPLSAEQLLQRAAQLSVGVVQIADNMPLELQDSVRLTAIRQQAEHLKITLELGTSGIVGEQLRAYVELSEWMNVRVLRVVPDSAKVKPKPEEIVEVVSAVLPDLQRSGVHLAIENHDRFPARTLHKIVQSLDSEYVGICLDTQFARLRRRAGDGAPRAWALGFESARQGFCRNTFESSEGIYHRGAASGPRLRRHSKGHPRIETLWSRPERHY